MILIEKKNRPRKLQVGGSILGHGEGFVPIKLATPGFAKTLSPVKMPRVPLIRGKSGKNSGNITDQDGFQSDIDHLNKLRSEVTKRMSERSEELGDAYLKSPEYKHDHAELNQVAQWIAQLKARKQNFLNNIKGKKIDNNELAIRGDQALVFDKHHSNYSIINLNEALREQTTNSDGLKTGRYEVQSIGQARNLRAHNIKFNGFEQLGKSLEEIIIDTPDKSDLQKLVQQAFKSSGIFSGKENDIILSDGTAVDLKDFDDYILDIVQGRVKIAGQKKTEFSSNRIGLEKARQSLMNTIYSKDGLSATYRNMAIRSLQNKNEDFAGLSDEEIEYKLEAEMTRQLAANMKYFIKEDFSDQYKEATGDGKGGDSEGDKTMMEAPSFFGTLLNPDRFLNLDFRYDYDDELFAIIGNAQASIIQDSDLIEGVYGKDDDRNLRGHNNIEKLVDSTNMSTAFTLADGTNLNKVYDGQGYDYAMIAEGTKPVILHRIPTYEDDNGSIRIAEEYLQFSQQLKEARDKAKHILFGKFDVLTETQLRTADKKVLEEYTKEDPKFKAFMEAVLSPDSKYAFRNMMMLEVLVPEVDGMEWWYGGGKETSDWGTLLKKADEDYYKSKMKNTLKDLGDVDTWSGVYSTVVFAPVNSLAQIKQMSFKGLGRISQTQGEWKGGERSEQTEREERKETSDFDEYSQTKTYNE